MPASDSRAWRRAAANAPRSAVAARRLRDTLVAAAAAAVAIVTVRSSHEPAASSARGSAHLHDRHRTARLIRACRRLARHSRSGQPADGSGRLRRRLTVRRAQGRRILRRSTRCVQAVRGPRRATRSSRTSAPRSRSKATPAIRRTFPSCRGVFGCARMVRRQPRATILTAGDRGSLASDGQVRAFPHTVDGRFGLDVGAARISRRIADPGRRGTTPVVWCGTSNRRHGFAQAAR